VVEGAGLHGLELNGPGLEIEVGQRAGAGRKMLARAGLS
jgi:hypothetical protein